MTTKNKPNERGRRGSADRSKRKPAKPYEILPARRTIDLLERVNDGIVAFDAEMNYIYVNPRGAEMLGRKPADLIGRNYWAEFPEAKDTPFAKAYVRALETQEALVIEDYYEPWDRWFENRIHPSQDGLTIFFTEITERKRTETRLRESREQLALAVRSANVGLWDWDLLTNKVYYSPEWKSQLGYEDHELSNDFSEWEIRVHPEDLERARATVVNYVENPYPNFQNEFRMRHKDGSYRWILAQASLAYDGQGKPIRMLGSHIDITDRKKEEERLRKSEEKFSRIFFASPVPMTISRLSDGRFLEANDSYLRHLEYAREEVVGKTVYEIEAWAHPEERARLVKEIEEKGYTRDMAAHYRAKSGRIGDIVLSAEKVELDGEPCILGVSIDVTERKRAEEELKRAKERLEEAERQANLGSWEFDATTAQGWWSPHMYRLFGHDPSKGFPSVEAYLDSIHPEDRELVLKEFNRMSEGREPSAKEYRTNPERGPMRHLWPIVNWERDRDGRPIRYFGSVVDITERKHAEQALRRSEQVLRLFVEHSPAAVAMFDREMRYIVASKRYLSDYDLGEQNLVGRSHYEVFPEIPERWKEIHRRCLAGAVERAEEDPFPRLSGKLDWIRWEIHPWYETNGEIGGVILFSEVITERKQARDELRLSHDRLAELSRRLVEAHESERRAIGRELHDQFGQMLTALKLTIEIALQLPPEEALKKAAQGKELVEDLLARVSALSLELRPPMLDDLGLLPALLWHVNRFQEQSGIEVDFKHSGIENRRFDPQIEITAYRIAQESLTNVARHARANRVRLEVRAEPSVALSKSKGRSVRKRGAWMEIEIEDDGIGFDPESALAKNRGLSGIHERVQLVGGTFHIESEKGRGTRKLIRLPLREEQE